jgi:hypothetical protein
MMAAQLFKFLIRWGCFSNPLIISQGWQKNFKIRTLVIMKSPVIILIVIGWTFLADYRSKKDSNFKVA